MLFILRNMFLDFGKVVDKIINCFFKVFLTECQHQQPKTKTKKKQKNFEIKTILTFLSSYSFISQPKSSRGHLTQGLRSVTVRDGRLLRTFFFSRGHLILQHWCSLESWSSNLHDSNDCNSSRHKFSVWKHSVKKCLFCTVVVTFTKQNSGKSKRKNEVWRQKGKPSRREYRVTKLPEEDEITKK